MTEQESIFNNLFIAKGGLFDVDLGISLAGKDRLRVFIGMKENIIRFANLLKVSYPNFPEIHFNLINNYSLNAAATKFEGKYYIGINIGVYFLIFDMFSKMLASKDVLTDIGNHLLETNDEKILSSHISEGCLVFNTANVRENTFLPRDPIRTNYAHHLTHIAIKFLVHHECAHILRGHVDFLSHSQNQTMWNEFENLQTKPILQPSFSQTMEMDADSLATNHAFMYANYMITHQNELDSFEKIVYKDWNVFVHDWIFAIYCLFKLFGFNAIDIQKAKQKTHPPSIIRLSLIGGNLTPIFSASYGGDKYHQIVVNAFWKGVENAEKAFTSVTFHENQLELFSSTILNEELNKYNQDIANNWNNVRPFIEPFAYGKLPDYK